MDRNPNGAELVGYQRMKKNLLQWLVCPHCEGNIELLSSAECDGETKDGIMECKTCKTKFPIRNFIPRFVPSQNYAQSFGFQWNRFARTQIDKFSGIDASRSRFYRLTGWPARLDGQKILEAGCGAGRFTQIAIETGAEVFSFDYSDAVEANMENNGLHPNFHLFQADIYKIPLKKGLFDKIFCFGVLQHCPDVKGAFMGLVPYLKPGGEIVIDIYALNLKAIVGPKYLLRPLTKRLSQERLLYIIQKVVPVLFPTKQWLIEKIPLVGKYLAMWMPVAYHGGFVPYKDKITYKQLLEWSVLDTFDMLAPMYDKPQRVSTVRDWFVEAGLSNIRVNHNPMIINAKGVLAPSGRQDVF